MPCSGHKLSYRGARKQSSYGLFIQWSMGFSKHETLRFWRPIKCKTIVANTSHWSRFRWPSPRGQYDYIIACSTLCKRRLTGRRRNNHKPINWYKSLMMMMRSWMTSLVIVASQIIILKCTFGRNQVCTVGAPVLDLADWLTERRTFAGLSSRNGSMMKHEYFNN